MHMVPAMPDNDEIVNNLEQNRKDNSFSEIALVYFEIMQTMKIFLLLQCTHSENVQRKSIPISIFTLNIAEIN